MSVSVPDDPNATLTEKAPAPRTLLGSRADLLDRLGRFHRGGLIPLPAEGGPQPDTQDGQKAVQFDHWNNRLDLRRIFGRVLAAFRARR